MKFKIYLFIILVYSGITGCMAQQKRGPYTYEEVYSNLRKAVKNEEKVRLLDLSNKDLRFLPLEVTQLKNLEVLILNNNKLATLPPQISDLKNLKRLELMNNELIKLPQEISDLKKLKKLNVAYNNLYEEDINFLKKALPDCYIITHIDI